MQKRLTGRAASFTAMMALFASPSIGTEALLHKDEPIAQARARLIMDGWTPVRIDQVIIPGERENLQPGTPREMFNSGYFEIEGCSGTGVNSCIFNYQKNGQCLRVVTEGEFNRTRGYAPAVDHWTDDCPE
jgi:hypothetical protein